MPKRDAEFCQMASDVFVRLASLIDKLDNGAACRSASEIDINPNDDELQELFASDPILAMELQESFRRQHLNNLYHRLLQDTNELEQHLKDFGDVLDAMMGVVSQLERFPQKCPSDPERCTEMIEYVAKCQRWRRRMKKQQSSLSSPQIAQERLKARKIISSVPAAIMSYCHSILNRYTNTL